MVSSPFVTEAETTWFGLVLDRFVNKGSLIFVRSWNSKSVKLPSL